MSACRLAKQGACIDRARPLRFTFEGRSYQGFAGDTLASALLANGVSVVGRSFKYHRARGIMAAGAEEPNALMRVGEGGRTDVNVPATQIDLYDGLVADAVNCWPNAEFDLGAVNNLLGRFVPAGFYYKTFLWPSWRFYEPFIRRAAGLGRPSGVADPDTYETRFAHCDVLIVGAGPAGLAAALAASATGARVMLVEQEERLGGSLRWRGGEVDGKPAQQWLNDVEQVLTATPEMLLLTRTVAAGYFDHNAIVLVQSLTNHLHPNDASGPRQRLWQVRAKEVILATGAIERPIVFPGNDRPGVMLASAVAQYIGDFGVLCGKTAVFFTNNDSAYSSAIDFVKAGGSIVALVDARAEERSAGAELIKLGVNIIRSGAVVATHGSKRLKRVRIKNASGEVIEARADLLAVSGGWSPTIHLHCQSGGKPQWDERFACLTPGPPVQREISIGACAGEFGLSAALRAGLVGGADAARACGYFGSIPATACGHDSVMFDIEPLWCVDGKAKAFVDLQNDVTADDIALAHRENFVSVEHLKRYTALGMGADQGKTSNVNALALMSELQGKPTAQSGVTRYRFPYTPLPFGVFGGVDRDAIFRPIRRLTLHDWHQAHGGVLDDYGSWLRPAHYLKAGETPRQAEQREAVAVRTGVGVFDGSPLGKIEVLGPDAAAFLDLIYANRMSDLAVGKCRYGLMLNELGVVIDDGVCSRFGENHFLVGATSAGATRIVAWLEEWLQCEWVNFNVIVAPVTQSWDVITVTGPRARDLLRKVGVDFDVSREAFPHLSWRLGQVGGIDARVFRVSYTGEVSFEINVAPSRMAKVWQTCLREGEAFGAIPVGIDAWQLLRTERGFLHVGADTDGTTTPLDIGWGRVLKRKGDFIGRRSLMRPADLREDRVNFVGVAPLNANDVIGVGFPILAKSGSKRADGYITSAGYSPTLRRYVALGMIEKGRARVGETISLASDHGAIAAVITEPGAFDPKGERVHG